MKCKEVCQQLSDYLDGMLDSSEMEAIEKHLEGCPACQKELEEIKYTIGLLQGMEQLEPPVELRDNIIAALPLENKKKPSKTVSVLSDRFRILGYAAVAAVMLFAAVVVSQQMPLPGGVGRMPAWDMADSEAPEGMGAMPEITEERAADGTNDYRAMQEESGLVYDTDAPERQLAGEIVDRRIIRTANLGLLVEDLEAKAARVIELVEENEGFVQHSGSWENEQQRTTNFIIRIPVDRFHSVVNQLETLGRVEHKELRGQDVTEEYVDLEARLRNLTRQEERYLEILDEADSVEDILNIERELERVRGQIESITARLRNLEEMTGLATIHINMTQLIPSEERITPPSIQRVLERAGQAFVGTINRILTLGGEAVVYLGRLLPYLPLLILAWLGIRRLRRKRKEEV